ncbi:MAG TPA: hypothetical protein PLU41_08340 [Acidobacteriota bacterium]|nr:hypothetical protein [Acidobacteriota bacterium]
MHPRRLTLTIILLGLLTAGAAAQERARVELNRQIILTQRQMIIRDNLPLTDAEAAAFWPLYREYHAAIEPLGDPLMDRLLKFAQSPATLSELQAGQLLDEWLDFEEALLTTRRQWVARFRAVLPASKVTRFYQLENKLDAVLREDVSRKIPLVP